MLDFVLMIQYIQEPSYLLAMETTAAANQRSWVNPVERRRGGPSDLQISTGLLFLLILSYRTVAPVCCSSALSASSRVWGRLL